jgi:hypothetical protein
MHGFFDGVAWAERRLQDNYLAAVTIVACLLALEEVVSFGPHPSGWDWAGLSAWMVLLVIDEAQNCTYGQIKMLLTRLGWHSTMVVTGDPEQTDLLPELSGLAEVARRLEPLEGVEVVRLTREDVVRHPLVGTMLHVL